MSAAGKFNPLDMQLNVKQNAMEINSYLKDLQNWNNEVKQKDADLKSGKLTLTKTAVSSIPIRGSAAPVTLAPTASRDAQRFLDEKQKGNDAFAKEKYEDAINHYSQCMILQPNDVIGPSNRSQALLKLHRYHEAEADATQALEIDPKHVKSLFRRAQARKELRKYTGAVQDLQQLIVLDSKNKAGVALLKESEALLEKQRAAKAALSQPIVSAAPVTLASAPVSVQVATGTVSGTSTGTAAASTAAAAPGAAPRRRMVIQEEDDDDEEEEEEKVQINKKTTTTASTATAAAAASPAKPATSSNPASPSSVATSNASSSSLTVPKSAYDFDATFRTIRGDINQVAAYFRLIDAKSFPVLLKTALDGNLLQIVVRAIREVFEPQKEFAQAFIILQGLVAVPRFNVAAMMMDSKDKNSVKSFLQSIARTPVEDISAASVQQVAKSYGVAL